MTARWASVLLLGLGGVAVGGLVTAIVGGVAATQQPGPAPTSMASPAAAAATPAAPSEELAATEAYLADIEPLAREGGRLVEQALKPAVRRLGEVDGGNQPTDQPLLDGADWTASMRAVRDQWVAREPPSALVEAHALFGVALDRYLAVAELLAGAADGVVDPMDLHDRAASLGDEADDHFDRAAALVQQHLASHGADPVAWLPAASR